MATKTGKVIILDRVDFSVNLSVPFSTDEKKSKELSPSHLAMVNIDGELKMHILR